MLLTIHILAICILYNTRRRIFKMHICYSISYSVTQEEWEHVYEETLELAQKLGLADWSKFYYKGIRHYAYCKIKEETKEEFGIEKHYWVACAEYNHLGDGEYFRLDRELNNRKFNKDAGPAILRKIDTYTNVSFKPYENQVDYDVTDHCTGFYFIRLLAILCLMESRLKEKIFIYGSISKSDCETAVELANKHLKEPIGLPARCDYNRLYEIVKTIDIPEEEKINLMENAYLGEIDLKYKKFIEEKFNKNTITQLWKNRFKDIEHYDFKNTLKAYLAYGFDFKDLFSYIPFTNKKEEYLKLLELIIEIENNRDRFSKNFGLTRDPKDNKVRGFSLEFRRSLFGPMNSTDIICYTFDEYVNELSKYLGDQIDVRNFLKGKIRDEDEDSFLLRLKEYCQKDNYYVFEGEENCDIIYSSELMYYKTGDTLSPYLLKEIKEAVKTNKERLSDAKFKELEGKDVLEQIYELIDIYPHFSARDIDWQHAIDYFNTHSDALKRYYPLFKMKFEFLTPAEDIATALFMNDEFYEFSKSL